VKHTTVHVAINVRISCEVFS